MKRRFNDTGLCVRKMHYMVDMTPQVKIIFDQFIEYGEYFSVISGRQFGKTTTLFKISKLLEKKKDYLLIDTSFEGFGNDIYTNEKTFSKGFLRKLYSDTRLKNKELAETFNTASEKVCNFETIKLKIREGKEEKLNSPWNIASDFNVDLSFKPKQIETLLEDYLSEHPKVKIPQKKLAEKLYYYTTGYPYLVSKMCKIIDENIISSRDDKNWYVKDVENAFEIIVYGGYETTLFDSIAKNLQNNEKLYNFIYELVIENTEKSFIANDKIVYLAKTYSIIKDKNKKCKIHNRIFEQRIYDLMLSIMDNSGRFIPIHKHNQYFNDKDIDLEYILIRFQKFFKENYSHTDKVFLECEARLIFLSYLQPIINSKGYTFKEPVVGEERKMDIVATYNEKRYVVELKIWRGNKYHQKSLQQLSDYLDIYSLKKGYLLIFDFNKNKKFKDEILKFEDKKIFTVWV